MADLSEIQSAQAVKITGADSSGVETFYADADSSGNLKTTNETIVANDASEATKSSLVAGSDGTNQRPLLTDSTGKLIITTIGGFGADFAFGDVTTAATTEAIVRKTAYTEQTTDAKRSIASASANDTAAGTGAQQVTLIYYTAAGVGPLTEVVTLNGTSYVNTVATDICFIENILVTRVGSNGSNVGILTLKAATAGGGATIGTVGAAANQTSWAHHYVAAGKTCNITGITCSHNGTTVGSGGVFVLKSQPIGVTGAVNIQVSDFVRLYGQSSTFGRLYGSPIKVVGPARIALYVTPETGSSTIYRGSIDFFEV